MRLLRFVRDDRLWPCRVATPFDDNRALASGAREYGDVVRFVPPTANTGELNGLVRKLGTSHTGFFHRSVRRVPGRLAIGATFRKAETPDGPRWIVQDVHAGGPADSAGLKPLDVLTALNGKTVVPPEQPMFPMGTLAALAVARNGTATSLDVAVPVPRSRKQPYSEPQPAIYSQLRDSIGYLKVSILPDLIGIDVSKEILKASEDLSQCDRLILDLRGHLGGGLGVLRLISILHPGKVLIGYTVTRRRAERGYRKEELPRLDRIPSAS